MHRPHHKVLHINIVNPGGGPDDGPPDHGGEDVIRKVGSSIPTLDKASPIITDNNLPAIRVHVVGVGVSQAQPSSDLIVRAIPNLAGGG